jgi:glycosyltransferase involved in cell wall biosynthesis
MPDNIFVSFIVIAYNEELNIARTINSITELEDLGEHEVVVVDDGSRDGTARIVSGIALRNPNVRLIKLPGNYGRGYARNTGITAARGALIAMIDADIILPGNWLARTYDALANHDAVGGIAVPDGDVAYVHKRFGLAPRVLHGTATVAGSNGLYRREIFDVANFDPALREGEDNALNYAMDRLGLSFATVPGLLVRHEENKTLGTSLKWLFDTGKGATRQLLTYREVRQPDLVTGAFVGTAALGLLLSARRHRMTGAAVPASFVLASSFQHIRSRFETSWSQWPRVAPAVAVDSAHLTAYFAGRLAGLTALWRRQPTDAKR